jgi:hypothetical protein
MRAIIRAASLGAIALLALSCSTTRSLPRASVESFLASPPAASGRAILPAGAPASGYYLSSTAFEKALLVQLGIPGKDGAAPKAGDPDADRHSLDFDLPWNLDHREFLAALNAVLAGEGIKPLYVDSGFGGGYSERGIRSVIFLDLQGSHFDLLTASPFLGGSYGKARSRVSFWYSGDPRLSPLESFKAERRDPYWDDKARERVPVWRKWFTQESIKAARAHQERLAVYRDAQERDRERERAEAMSSADVFGPALRSVLADMQAETARLAAGNRGSASATGAGAGSGAGSGAGASEPGAPGSPAPRAGGIVLQTRKDEAPAAGQKYATYSERGELLIPVSIAYGPGQAFADEATALAEAKRVYLEKKAHFYDNEKANRARIDATNKRIMEGSGKGDGSVLQD